MDTSMWQNIQPIDPTQSLAYKWQQMRQAKLQQDQTNQLNALKLKDAGMEMQQKQMTLADLVRQQGEQQTVRNAYATAMQPQQASVSTPGLNIGGVQMPDKQTNVQGPPQFSQNALYAAMQQGGVAHLIPDMQAKQAMADLAKQKELADVKAKLANASKDEIEAVSKHLDVGGRLMSYVLEAPPPLKAQIWPGVRAQMIANGAPESQLPAQYDANTEALLTAKRNEGMSVKDFADAQLHATTAAETNRHNTAEEALTKSGQAVTMRGQNMADARERNKNGEAGSLTPAQQQLVDEIGAGKMAMGRMEYILARNPGLMAAVAAKYPDFDSSKIKSYGQAYRDYTGAGKIGIQLNAGSTAMRHFAQLRDINDKNPTTVRIPGTEANKAYNNLLDTVAGEVLTFYGTPKTNETIASVKSTLGGLTNRNAAINEQALAMGQKFDELENTWNNAAPSAAYQAPMPGYSEAAKAARAKLDPDYAKRVTASAQPPTAQVPKVGDVQEGFVFMGGDPANKSNWKPAPFGRNK